MEGRMADDKTLRAPQDASPISLDEDREVRCWTEKFGISKERLVEAVHHAGPGAKGVEEWLVASFNQFERI
jgi:hypothetical protein